MKAAKPIRVMIVDDHLMVRRGLVTFLRAFANLELVGEAAGGEAAVQLCDRVKPDVVLMDLVMPDVDGATATRLIRERHPDVQVLALTSYKDQELVQGALEAGAIGYLLKDVSAEELANAICLAHAGRASLSPEAAQALVQGIQRPSKPTFQLTPREREVLALLTEGLSNNQIAARLMVSETTVKSHVSNILSKLCVGSRAEAAVTALRNKLV